VIRKSENGICPRAGAVLLFAVLLLVSPALTHGANAQSVDRTDTPEQGALRIRFDTRILTWSREFLNGSLQPLGAPLTGDALGTDRLPTIARLQQDLRTASGIPGYLASIGQGAYNARAEVRVTPFTAEFGLTNRLSVGFTLPLIRTAMRAHMDVLSTGASLGANPLATVGGADGSYATFFNEFNSAITTLSGNIAGGQYGCPSSPQCAQAQSTLSRATALRDALNRTVYGVGATGSPFVPLAGSTVGNGIDSSVVQLQRALQNTYSVAGFNSGFLLSSDTLTSEGFQALLTDTISGYGYSPLRNTWRYGLGDIALHAKLRLGGKPYALALGGLVRLGTGTRDSILEIMDLPIADHQTAYEASVTQELTIAHHLWLNLAVRAGTSLGTTRARRVAPVGAFLVPYQATTLLAWDAGDYLAVDFAPMYRLTPTFAVGGTVGYWTKTPDNYSYLSSQDSLNLASRLGMAVPASVLDESTRLEQVRVGLAVTYATPKIEGGFTVEKTISGEGGLVPATTVFRIVMRIDWKLL
jgi:hypothetical protein